MEFFQHARLIFSLVPNKGRQVSASFNLPVQFKNCTGERIARDDTTFEDEKQMVYLEARSNHFCQFWRGIEAELLRESLPGKMVQCIEAVFFACLCRYIWSAGDCNGHFR